MTLKSKAMGLALACSSFGLAAVATAQEAPKPVQVSEQAMPAIRALDVAVKAKNYVNLPTLIAEANAKAKTPQERLVVAQLQIAAALDQKDDAATLKGLDAALATGLLPADQVANFQSNRARLLARLNPQEATAQLEQLAVANPTNVDYQLQLIDLRRKQGRKADAAQLLQKTIDLQTAAGKPVPPQWRRLLVGLTYEAKLPGANQAALALVKAAPTSENWRDALLILQPSIGLTGPDLIDFYRLQRAAGALKGEADYYRYADMAALRGLPGEAKAVLEEGFAANEISRSKPAFRDLYASVSGKIASDKASLSASERNALGGTAARLAMSTGDAYLGYGDNQKAAALYRAALGKSGADAGMANLRLGIALARAGDNPAARTAFDAVTGKQAQLAKLWLLWLDTRA